MEQIFIFPLGWAERMTGGGGHGRKQAVDGTFAPPPILMTQRNGELPMPSSSDLVVEKCLAGAHRSIASAIEMASTWSDLAFHDDLQLIQLELERMAEDLLRGRKRRSATINHRA